MAVLAKDFTWEQTNDQVVVKVPLKGVPLSTVDVLTYDTYIKAFLKHPILESSSRCTISNGEVEFHLEKVEKNLLWNSLCADLSKEEKRKARNEVLEKVLKRNQEKTSAKQELLQSLQRKAVQQQIDLETKEKKTAERIRNHERATAMEDLEIWKSKQKEQGEVPALLECLEDVDAEEKKSCDIWDDTQSKSSEEEDQLDESILCSEEDLQPVPITRQSGSIKIKFTPRAFPTPQRESKIDEEQAWLKKQAAALRSVGFVAEDLRPEECNPEWLKEKGDSFFQVGNYLGAVSAYSHGIKLSSEMASLYVNRSAAHYALGNLQRVIEDCSRALELMVPKVSLNEDSRAKCHARRGAALCKLGMLRPSLADLELALAIKPDDSTLQNDIEEVRNLLQRSEEGG